MCRDGGWVTRPAALQPRKPSAGVKGEAAESKTVITFADVAGVGGAKAELMEVGGQRETDGRPTVSAVANPLRPAAGGCLPEGRDQVPQAECKDALGCPAKRPARHRQDPAGQGGGGRGRGALLRRQRLGICGALRWTRGCPGPRAVCGSQEAASRQALPRSAGGRERLAPDRAPLCALATGRRVWSSSTSWTRWAAGVARVSMRSGTRP